jgi:hypothetical protein
VFMLVEFLEKGKGCEGNDAEIMYIVQEKRVYLCISKCFRHYL